MRTFIVTITLTVSPDSDEHLQTPRGIEDEVHSWLTGLDADVHAVTIKEQP